MEMSHKFPDRLGEFRIRNNLINATVENGFSVARGDRPLQGIGAISELEAHAVADDAPCGFEYAPHAAYLRVLSVAVDFIDFVHVLAQRGQILQGA